MLRSIMFFALVALPAQAADPTLYTGVKGARVIDSGVIVVATGSSAREETFEYVKRPDGGYTLVSTITAADGSYRVNGRFDYDGDWNATTVHGAGLYDGKPVDIELKRSAGKVAIRVTGDGKPTQSTSNCAPSCLIDMAPSANPMFVMTRHYDLARGGEQDFLWAGQDLTQARSLTDDHVQISFKGNLTVKRVGGVEVNLRRFFFLENIPQPNGQMFKLEFDIWTDLDHRPMAFRVRPPGSNARGTFGVRKGYEDIQALILPE